MNNRIALLGLSLTAVFFLPGQSCITVTNQSGGSNNNGTPPPDPTEVTLRFINGTGRAVDVQFYATGQTVTTIETDLFAAGNLVTANIGFAGSGLLEAGATDQVTISCANATTVGTRGGRFLDANSGDLIGTGRQLVLFSGLQYGCGDMVTFTYTESGGSFSTGLSVQ